MKCNVVGCAVSPIPGWGLPNEGSKGRLMDEIRDMADLHSGRARHSLPHGHEGHHPHVSEDALVVHYNGEYCGIQSITRTSPCTSADRRSRSRRRGPSSESRMAVRASSRIFCGSRPGICGRGCGWRTSPRPDRSLRLFL